MIKGLGRKAAFGIAAGALTLAGLAGAASAGMGGNAARTAGSTAGNEVVTAAQTAQTALWYGRGTAELAVGETAEKADRPASAAVAKAYEGSEDRPPQNRPVRDAMEQISRTAAETEGALVDNARAVAATIAEASETAATALDTAEDSLRR